MTIAMLLMVEFNANAVVVNVNSSDFSGEMVCPVESGSRSHINHPPGAGVQGAPEIEELVDFLKGDLRGREGVAAWPTRFNFGPGPLRVGLWGDSHVAARFFSDEIIAGLGLKLSQIGQQFLPPTMGMPGVRLPLRRYCKGPGWKLKFNYRQTTQEVINSDSLAGLENLENNSYLWLDFRASDTLLPRLNGVDIVFSDLPVGETALIGVSLDNEDERLINLSPDEPASIQIRSNGPISILKMRVIVGHAVIEGFIQHYVNAPNLYFDTLGIPSSTGTGWARINPKEHRRRHLEQDYDIVMLEYGTNEGNVRILDAENYRRLVRNEVSNLKKTYPGAACVLIGAPDRGVLTRKDVRNKNTHRAKLERSDALLYSNIHSQINQVQREVANEFSCVFWDWQRAMGGNGAAYRWFYQSPSLMSKDLTHLSVRGYQESAKMFGSWLGLKSFMSQPSCPQCVNTAND
jgi:lysophospholipase L1-like esterase